MIQDDRKLAVAMGAAALDIGKTIRPHPILGETIATAARVEPGCCTDPAPLRRK